MPTVITEMSFADVVNRICQLCAYPQTVDPAGSTDLKHGQMRAAVNDALEEMLSMRDWQDIMLEGTISVVADSLGQTEKGFALPSDFKRMIDDTEMYRQRQMPAIGPITPQGWSRYLVSNASPQMSLYWQTRADQLFVLAPPYPTPVNFDFLYMSRAQVIDENTTDIKNIASKNGDKFKLDAYLITLLARKKYLEWNKFDSTSATNDFNNAFESSAGGDTGATVLSLNPGRGTAMISSANLPNTGYGS